MIKNLMPEIAKLLGVVIGEVFHIKNSNGWTYRLNFQGLETKCQGNEWLKSNLLPRLLNGELEIIKLPWKPKFGEIYYHPMIRDPYIRDEKWYGTTFDCAMCALGMCYRTKEEAEAHFAEDYKKLTGKELKEP